MAASWRQISTVNLLWHVKKAIPYGQALRLRRISSDERKFRRRTEELVGWSVDRGYKEDFVREQLARVSNFG